MKIVFMTPKLSYSGAPKIIAWVSNEMVKMGHDVTIIVMYRSKCEQLLDERVKVFSLKKPQNKFWIYRNTIGILRAVFGCRRIIKGIKPDAVISFLDSVSYVYILLNHYFWKDVVILSERADPYSRNKVKARTILSLMKKSDLVIFQTVGAKTFFEEKYGSLNGCVIPNPVVINNSVLNAIKERRKIIPLMHQQIKISSVGRLSLKQKRQDILLKAMAELKRRGVDFKLFIYGSGSDEGRIRSLIEEYSLGGYVELMGQRQNIALEIFDSDCFVLTSDFEGIPNALIEAMSIGIPCVSTDCSPGGAKLLIRNGKNGFLVDRRDYNAIADRIIWIKEHKTESATIGNNATGISKDYSEKKIIKIWEKEVLKVARRQDEKR